MRRFRSSEEAAHSFFDSWFSDGFEARGESVPMRMRLSVTGMGSRNVVEDERYHIAL
jgi:hypothetical protein